MNEVELQRQAAILDALREMLAWLLDAVGSGRLGFDYAVKEYVQQADNPLAQAFRGYVHTMQLGDETFKIVSKEQEPQVENTRRAALRAVADALHTPAVTEFVEALIVSQDTKTSLYRTLLAQSERLS